MLHGVAAYYFQVNMPQELRDMAPDAVTKAEVAICVHMLADLDWLEREIAASTGTFLVGDTVSAADIMMLFSTQMILSLLGPKLGKTWPGIEAWLESCKMTAAYKRAAKKSGYAL